MAGDNSSQIADWNGPLGARWATQQEEMDAFTAPFGQDGLAAAAAQPGERVIDVGCGAGATSLALARTVGPGGQVVGVDVARQLLAVARRRGEDEGLKQLSFSEADASSAALPSGLDLIFSRFGVMFFAEPIPAFAHMRKAMKNTGRLAFVCWRSAKENPWASVPVMAARQALGLAPTATTGYSPGPFAFADDAWVRGVLEQAGFRDVAATPHEHLMPLGRKLREAAEYAVRSGPVARMVREAKPEDAPKIIDAVEKALAPLAAADGAVALPGRTWVVTAKAG
jgi:ubiquinone/menaquinone biosynthesis C-methylase UbiE